MFYYCFCSFLFSYFNILFDFDFWNVLTVMINHWFSNTDAVKPDLMSLEGLLILKTAGANTFSLNCGSLFLNAAEVGTAI